MVKPLILIAVGLFFLVGTALDRFRIVLNPPVDTAGHVLSLIKKQFGEAALRKLNYALGAFFLVAGIYGLIPLLRR